MNRSDLDVLNRARATSGTGRRALLAGGLLSALALGQRADAKQKQKKSKPRKKPTQPKLLWAVVDSGGTLAFGSGATAARKMQGNGTYEVTFDRDITECATIAQVTYLSGIGEVYVSTGGTTAAVFTYDTQQNRVAANKSFHLMVMC
jgi:hypothetical protein